MALALLKQTEKEERNNTRGNYPRKLAVTDQEGFAIRRLRSQSCI